MNNFMNVSPPPEPPPLILLTVDSSVCKRIRRYAQKHSGWVQETYLERLPVASFHESRDPIPEQESKWI